MSFFRALGVFVILAAVYLLTFNGQPVSTDELMLFDGARSFARNGSLELALTNELIPYSTPAGDQPVPSLTVEPLAVYAAAALIRAAIVIPGVGVLHTAWLLNLIATALTGAILYGLVARLGYGERTAVLTALIYGVGTIAFPYAMLFFREPLLTLCGVAGAYAALALRQNIARGRRRRGALWGAVLALALYGAALSKDAGLLLAPAMVIYALPGVGFRPVRRLTKRTALLVLGAGGIILLIAALILIWRAPDLLARLSDGRLGESLRYTPEALAGYLISPGFSLWTFSPVLLAGIGGAFLLMRERRWREAISPLVALLPLAVGYAVLHGAYWYGGLGWGARFLVPAVPFLTLWTAPIIEWIITYSKRERKPRRMSPWAILFGGLIALSVGVQLLGTLYPITTFSRALSEESRQTGREILPWREGVWTLAYIPPIVTLREAAITHPAPAWAHIGGTLPAVTVGVGVVLGLGILALWGRSAVGFIAVMSLALLTFLTLRAYYPDPRYGGDDPQLAATFHALSAAIRPGDTVILENRTYRPYVMNYDKGANPIYALPYAQGERQNPAEPPFVQSEDMEERAEPFFQIVFARLAGRASAGAQWWFITENTPFTPDRYRVTEHYLARHYFPIRVLESDPPTWVIAYAPIPAPPLFVPPNPARLLNADFGGIVLSGVDLPRGETLAAGDVFPISLLWRFDGFAEGVEPFDYSVNVSLVDSAGVVRAQRAETPLGSFGQMTTWVRGGYYRDNHALALPATLPAGEYEVWVLVFDWRTGGNLPLRGDEAGEYIIAGRVRVL
ncbi:MAG: hypothetical protein HS103_13055 [Anaerolineales bacterium]|nr:hypothetical protein [Anaerolineales bacterium]